MNENTRECKIMDLILQGCNIFKLILHMENMKIKSEDCDNLRRKIKDEYSFFITDEDMLKVTVRLHEAKEILKDKEYTTWKGDEKIGGKMIHSKFEF